MRPLQLTCAFLLCTPFLSPQFTFAQTFSNGDGFRVEVYSSEGVQLGNVDVEIQPLGGGFNSTVLERTSNSMGGGLGAGQGFDTRSWRVRVFNQWGALQYETIVQADPSGAPVRLYLPNSANITADKPTGKRVSLHELTHKVPGKARKELERAVEARRKNDIPGMVAHLRKCVAIDPEFLVAQEMLAIADIEKGEFPEAQKALETVLKFDPNNERATSNLVIAYFSQKKYEEAEETARRAVTLNGSRRNHYLLGTALAAQDKPAALEELEVSASEFPRAHAIALQLLVKEGNLEAAKKHAQAYLATAESEFRDDVGDWLKRANAMSDPATADLKRKTVSQAAGAIQ